MTPKHIDSHLETDDSSDTVRFSDSQIVDESTCFDFFDVRPLTPCRKYRP
jgi:hypothetical protein